MLHMPARSCISDADLLTAAEVARMVDRTVATVNRWAATGRLTVAAQANGRVFRRSDVHAFIEGLAREADQRAIDLRAIARSSS